MEVGTIPAGATAFRRICRGRREGGTIPRPHPVTCPPSAGGHARRRRPARRRQRRPDPAYLWALGGATGDELPDLAGLLRAGEAAGLEPVWVATSTPRDGEAYEWALIANGAAFAAAHPDDRVTPDVRAWISRARERLLAPGGRDTLGFALMVLRRRA